MLYERRHARLMSDYGGLAKSMPVFTALFLIITFSSVAVPGTNGFVGEFLVLLGSYGAWPVATAIATTGVIFAAAYLLWALQRIIFNALDKPENEAVTDLTPRELAVLLPLVAGIIWMGVYPKPVLERMEPAARRYIEMTAVSTAPAAAPPQAMTLGGGR
jgi:NADH-quinone oxidoreductase subunit M